MKYTFDSLYLDFYHPNPKINRKAAIDLARYFPDLAIKQLILNFRSDDILIRRKSVIAFAEFGEEAISHLRDNYLQDNSLNINLCCLKALVQIAARQSYESFPKELYEVVNKASKDTNPTIILTLISLLRQIGKPALAILFNLARDQNILKAKASITAIGEIDDSSATIFLESLLEERQLDPLILESINYSLSFLKIDKETTDQLN